MDLFKAIFAESSSSESETEAQQDEEDGERPASQSQEEAAPAIGDNQKEVVEAEQKPRKTRWQDLSAVTSRPLTTAADLHGSSAGKMAGTVSRDAAANRETVHNGEQMEPKSTQEAKQIFGPALPPSQCEQ